MTADEKLLWGVVHNAHRRSRDRAPRWTHVIQAIGCGRTWAIDLCRRFGADPDEMLGTECVAIEDIQDGSVVVSTIEE